MLVTNQSFVTAQMVLAIVLADKKSQGINGEVFPQRNNYGIGLEIATEGVNISIAESWASNDITLLIKIAGVSSSTSHNFERDFDKAAFYIINQLLKYNPK